MGEGERADELSPGVPVHPEVGVVDVDRRVAQRVTTLVDGKDGERGDPGSPRRVFEQRREAEGVGARKRVPVVPATRLDGADAVHSPTLAGALRRPVANMRRNLAVGRRVEVGQAAQNRLLRVPLELEHLRHHLVQKVLCVVRRGFCGNVRRFTRRRVPLAVLDGRLQAAHIFPHVRRRLPVT